jgi:hypothetical protein
MQLIIFILATFGITNIVTKGKIFEAVRSWFPEDSWFGTLIRCPMCFGFWAALFISLCGLRVTPDLEFFPQHSAHFLDASIGSGSTWIIYVVLEKLDGYSL